MSDKCSDIQDEGNASTAPKSHRTRLSPDIWAQHKDVIIDLYKNKDMSLQSVIGIMAAEYGFEASRRNYQTQLKKWQVTKNLNKTAKEAIQRERSAGKNIFEGGKAPKNLERRLRRHNHAQKKRSFAEEGGVGDPSPEAAAAAAAAASQSRREEVGQPSVDVWWNKDFACNSDMLSSNVSNFTSEGEDSVSSDALVEAHAPSSSGCSSHTCASRSLTAKAADEPLRDTRTPEGRRPSGDSTSRQRGHGDFSHSHTPAPVSIPPRITLTDATLNLSTVLRCVQEFSKSHLPTLGEEFDFQSMASSGSSSSSSRSIELQKYWLNVQNCVYLYKVNDISRAEPLLQEICLAPSGILEDVGVGFMRELLSVFSPVNFRRHPKVRERLLGHFTKMAEAAFGGEYAVTVLCKELQKDEDSRYATEVALRYLLSCMFVARSPLTFDTERSIIALLRRDNALAEATQMALNCSNFGSTSRPDHVRDAAKELAHVYMDMGELDQAKVLCMKRVGKTVAMDGHIGHQYHDRRTVAALEDLAKIEEELKAFKHSVTWLGHAIQIAKDINEPPIVVAHILDKLDRMLRECGRVKDAEQIMRLYGPSSWNAHGPNASNIAGVPNVGVDA